MPNYKSAQIPSAKIDKMPTDIKKAFYEFKSDTDDFTLDLTPLVGSPDVPIDWAKEEDEVLYDIVMGDAKSDSTPAKPKQAEKPKTEEKPKPKENSNEENIAFYEKELRVIDRLLKKGVSPEDKAFYEKEIRVINRLIVKYKNAN